MVVAGVVAVGRVGERNAVLEQGGLGGARRVEPRTPMLGRIPKPSSSRTASPGSLRRASLVVNTRLLSSVLESSTWALPGMFLRFSRLPTTSTRGITYTAVSAGTAGAPWARAVPATRGDARQNVQRIVGMSLRMMGIPNLEPWKDGVIRPGVLASVMPAAARRPCTRDRRSSTNRSGHNRGGRRRSAAGTASAADGRRASAS